DMRLKSEANASWHEHWGSRKKRRDNQKLVTAAELSHHRPPSAPCAVTLTRIAPRPFDSDNLARAFKAVRDQIANWLGIDDGDRRVQWHYRQERGAPKQHRVRIEWEHVE